MKAHLQEVPIVKIDKSSGAFIDADENRYFEVESDVFTLDGIAEEGAVGFHGSGSHGGHIVLKPFYKRYENAWVNLYIDI